MADPKTIFSKFEFIDQVGRTMGFDMDKPEYRGKVYVDCPDYIEKGMILKPEEATREAVDAYVCGGLEGVRKMLFGESYSNK